MKFFLLVFLFTLPMSLHGFERNIPKEDVESISILYSGWALRAFPNGVLMLSYWADATAVDARSVCTAEAFGDENTFDILYEKYAKDVSILRKEDNHDVSIQFMEVEQDLKYPLPTTRLKITPEIKSLFRTVLDSGIPFNRERIISSLRESPLFDMQLPSQEEWDTRWQGKGKWAAHEEFGRILDSIGKSYDERKAQYLERKKRDLAVTTPDVAKELSAEKPKPEAKAVPDKSRDTVSIIVVAILFLVLGGVIVKFVLLRE
ncbi:MAG: hypothetical protein LBV12_01815 [Puniceicoccales bacterium]|jgi:hypothetical protein|nr:hypothetical protein [Puniceicoccales bacterium]